MKEFLVKNRLPEKVRHCFLMHLMIYLMFMKIIKKNRSDHIFLYTDTKYEPHVLYLDPDSECDTKFAYKGNPPRLEFGEHKKCPFLKKSVKT